VIANRIQSIVGGVARLGSRKARYVNFRDVGRSTSGKTRLWLVVPTVGGGALGLIRWYSPWRRYVFAPHTETIYCPSCLSAIGEFCEQATRDHRAELIRAKAA